MNSLQRTWKVKYLFLFLISFECFQLTLNLDCEEFFWECDSGDECIEEINKCDGQVDCKDGSDEIAEYCINRSCSRLAERCVYGACIPGKTICDGKQQCADGSDEIDGTCDKPKFSQSRQGSCQSYEMQCKTSGECIPLSDTCDGVKTCADGSDETLEICGGISCNKNLFFQCGYGACISIHARCNQTEECVDGSDESSEMCNTPRRRNYRPSQTLTSPPISTISTATLPTLSTLPWIPPTPTIPTTPTFCLIPTNSYMIVRHGITNRTIEADRVQHNVPIKVSCRPGYALKGHSQRFCNSGKWSSPWPSCFHFCTGERLRSGFSTIVTFELNGIDVSRKNTFEPGTIAKIKCAEGFERPSGFLDQLTCSSWGGWDQDKRPCKMQCGVLGDSVTIFSKGGPPVNATQAPWHVGIYNSTDLVHYSNICAGTLISPKTIVTAAHCFHTRDNIPMLRTGTYAIAAGKLYREYDDPNEPTPDLVVKRIVANIWIHPDFTGKDSGYYGDIAILKVNEFIPFSDVVRPVCLKNVRGAEAVVKSGIPGSFTAWNQITAIERESTLHLVQMSSLSYDECRGNIESNQGYKIGEDKFCGASVGNTYACKGDSGSGFIISEENQFVLLGIVSFSPVRTQDCSNSDLLVMTNALLYLNNLAGVKKKEIDNDS